MRRILIILTLPVIAVFAAPSNPAFGAQSTVQIFPPSKYVPLTLSSYAETNVDAALAVGQNATNQRRAQGFKIPVSRTVGRVNLWLKASGAPTDNLTVEIQSDSAGVPSGTVVPNGTSSPVAGSSVGTSYGWVAFDFPTPPQLTAGTLPYTQYHLVLKRSGPIPDPNNYYYVWGADQSSPGYSDGVGSVYDSGSWHATSPATDHAFQVRPIFIVDVYAKVIGTTTDCPPPNGTQACGLGGYGFTVLFDPTAMKYVSVQNGSFLGSTGRLPFMCDNSVSHNPLNGAVGYSCFSTGNPPGGPTPLGPEGSGVLAEITFVPLAEGTTALQFQDAILAQADPYATQIPATAGSGSVTVGDYGTADSDGDGCADIEEAGDDPMKGGNRNPNAWYDFYDVPVPALIARPGGTYSNSVGLTDVLAVNSYSGVRTGDAAYEADVNGNGVRDGLEYDRSPSPPPNPGYDAGPPSGAIGLSDVLAANSQSGNKCTLGTRDWWD
jgi:hypothetical protein